MILTPWFKKFGWTYIPRTIGGSLITIACIALCGWLVFTFDRTSHSLLDTIAHFLLYFTVVAGWWNWLAAKTSVTHTPHERIQ
ncbi:hypothetical protein GA0116948_106149 [Chitinophaga costaii]|uniref:Uncharacterized protein n=1 Tax=Chitinophaga costaii TaxID=1335309 RepID=A0A1C4DW67_9BACT|nr:hypothetical protein [Chitinophaga costaii]PUZ27828.1 hypothetical protein DCM91_06375 [Chitinophaga costaii]SCC35510.1 hypothetical protein GA0116948_106149 [Chitinophaga costaii]